MEIPDGWAALLVSAVHDAVRYQEQLLTSQTLRDRDDYEEHLMHLSQFLEYVKTQYAKVEHADQLPLDKLP